jgi:hypothetical protein
MAGTQNQPTEYEQVSYNDPSGSQWGRTTNDLIGFLGTAPTGLSTIVVASTSTASVSTSPFGFTTSTQANSIVAAILELQRKGLIA